MSPNESPDPFNEPMKPSLSDPGQFNLDEQLDQIASPEEIAEEVARINQRETQRRIATSGRELLTSEPDKKHLFFRPVRPPMVPVERKSSDPIEEMPEGFRRAKLFYGDDVLEHVKIGVVKRWNSQLPMNNIVRWANDFLRSHGKNLIEAIDIFAIVDYEFNLQQPVDGNDTKRSNCEPVRERHLSNEMNLAQFRAFIFQWKRGAKFKQCMDAAAFTSQYFGRERFAELSARWRAESLAIERDIKARRRDASVYDKMLGAAFKCKFNGLPHLVIPYPALPNEILRELPKIRDYQPMATILPPVSKTVPANPLDDPESNSGENYDATALLSQLDEIAGEETERTLPGLPIEAPGVPDLPPESPLDNHELDFEE